MERLLDLFESDDFDVEYFVSESIRTGKANLIMKQLDSMSSHVNTELRANVRGVTDCTVESAAYVETRIADLMQYRESVSGYKGQLTVVYDAQRARVDNIKSQLRELSELIEVNKLLKKCQKISIDSSKLRAQFPSDIDRIPLRDLIDRAYGVVGTIESLSVPNFENLKFFDFIQNDILFIENFKQKLLTRILNEFNFLDSDEYPNFKIISILFNLNKLFEIIKLTIIQFIHDKQSLYSIESFPSVISTIASLEMIIETRIDNYSGIEFVTQWPGGAERGVNLCGMAWNEYGKILIRNKYIFFIDPLFE